MACDEALALFRNLDLPEDRARCLMNQAACLWSLGRNDEALASYDEALPLYRQYGLPENLARCLMNRALCLDDLGRQGDALVAFGEAVSLHRQHCLPADLATCLMNWANCLDDLGRLEEALAAYDEALPLFSHHGLPANYARCLMNRASSLEALGRHEEALAAYNETLSITQDRGLPEDLTKCLMNRATCLQSLGRYQEALIAYDEAFSGEDRVSTTLQEPANRTRSREQAIDHYRSATLLALEEDQRDRAWGYAQQAKGRTLIDLLSVRAELTTLDRQELLLRQQYEAGFVDEESLRPGMTRIGYQRRAQQAARLGHDPRTPMALADVAVTLHPGEALLDAFTVNDDGSLVLFLLRSDQPAIAWVGGVEGTSLMALIDRWQDARSTWNDATDAVAQIHANYPGTNPAIVARRERLLAAGAIDASREAAFALEQQVLAELGHLIIAPVLEHLDPSVTTLILSLDGLLHRLPLAAVMVPDASGNQQPLLERFALQLVPTATSLAILRGPHGPRVSWPPALLAAAPFATDNPRFKGIPESGLEVQAVADLLTATDGPAPITLRGEDATRSCLLHNLPSACILHLATHGGAFEPGETVLDYRIFLAEETEIRVRELYDGDVTLKDVVLVTLSACSLGQVVQQGAEASGFVQAFLQAGAGVVLAPIWAVYDRPTRLLMERFYAELTAEEPPTVATAWRRACTWLRTKTEFAHPVFWAGFLPNGDASLRLIPTP